MEAIRTTISRETLLSAIDIPAYYGDQVEVIILPTKASESTAPKNVDMTVLEEQSGFFKTILADEREDVWNGL